mgnify:CR=1 FL=1
MDTNKKSYRYNLQHQLPYKEADYLYITNKKVDLHHLALSALANKLPAF